MNPSAILATSKHGNLKFFPGSWIFTILNSFLETMNDKTNKSQDSVTKKKVLIDEEEIAEEEKFSEDDVDNQGEETCLSKNLFG